VKSLLKHIKSLVRHLKIINVLNAKKYLRITGSLVAILQNVTVDRVLNIIRGRLQGKEELMNEIYFKILKQGTKFNMDRMRE
jgi:hypothetical protein